MSKTFLVTGAAGFIGSHTAEAFLRRGDKVIGLDNFNDYYDPSRKRQNVKEIRKGGFSEDAFKMVEGDIRDKELCATLIEQHKPNAIVHLAAMAGVRASIDDPYLYYNVNLIGTLNLLEAARASGTNQFVFASTSSAYGNTKQVPFIETDSADRPLAPYPASKRAAEMLGHTFHHLHGMNFTALRFFTVYGPRGRPDMMAYKVLDNIFFNKEVPLFNNGKMHRDWTYVDDIVSGIATAADRPLGYEVINLGRGEPILLADFVTAIEKLAGKKAALRPAPMMDADVAYTYANASKARELLAYAPRTSVAEGVKKFWEWYQTTVLASGAP